MSRLSVRSPYDGQLVGELPVSSRKDADAALGRAHAIVESRQLLQKDERLRILERLAFLVERDAAALAELATREGGKPIVDSRIELERAVVGIKTAIAHLRVDAGREIPMGLSTATRGRRAHSFLEPRGVVLAISAFNHPMNLAIHQVVPAIAVGCPVIFKPATATPLSSAALFRLLEEAGLPGGYAEMLVLAQKDAEELVADPRLAFLSFIGSAEVGNRLRSRLAPGVTCVLEHGGAAPVILHESADFELAANAIRKGGYYHAGQVCVSVQRVYVPRQRAREFSEQLARGVRALRTGDPLLEETEVGPLISEAEVVRVHDWVEDATRLGATLLAGGERLSGQLYAPTLLFEPSDAALVSTKEIFGPVVAIYPYDELEEAIRRANALPFVFQAAAFVRDLEAALELSRNLRAMTVLINDHTAFRADWMPFGGLRESGQGLGGIPDTMRELQFEKLVVFREP